MTHQLKPLSKQDRSNYSNRYQYGEFVPAEYFLRALLTIDELEFKIAQAEPGTAAAIVHAMFDLAEKKCGHNPASSRHGLTTIRKWIMDAKARINELEARQQTLIEALKKQLGIAFHSANCAFDGANNPCDCGIEQAKAVLREIGEGKVNND